MVSKNGRDRMKRYSAQFLEKAFVATLLRNTTYGVVIIDMERYNARQHGCAACFPFYYDLVTQYKMYAPTCNINFINTPGPWEEVGNILLPIINPITSGVVKILGNNKKEWQKVLLEAISPEELTPQFGGTKKT